MGLKDNEIRKKSKIVLSWLVKKDLKVIMEEDCAETPRQDDTTYCQNFNKSHSQQRFIVNPFKSGAGERGGPFYCNNKGQATRVSEGMSFAEHGWALGGVKS